MGDRLQQMRVLNLLLLLLQCGLRKRNGGQQLSLRQILSDQMFLVLVQHVVFLIELGKLGDLLLRKLLLIRDRNVVHKAGQRIGCGPIDVRRFEVNGLEEKRIRLEVVCLGWLVYL